MLPNEIRSGTPSVVRMLIGRSQTLPSLLLPHSRSVSNSLRRREPGFAPRMHGCGRRLPRCRRSPRLSAGTILARAAAAKSSRSAASIEGLPGSPYRACCKEGTPQTGAISSFSNPSRDAYVLTAVHAAGDADRLGALALERELGGVLDHQNGAVRRGEAVARGLEMAGEDLRLADPIIGEEAVSRLRVRPVLACERQASPDRARHTLDEFAQALAQTLVHEHTSGELALPPGVDRRVHGAPHP